MFAESLVSSCGLIRAPVPFLYSVSDGVCLLPLQDTQWGADAAGADWKQGAADWTGPAGGAGGEWEQPAPGAEGEWGAGRAGVAAVEPW